MDFNQEDINMFIKDEIIDRITIISKNKFDVFFEKQEKGLRFKIRDPNDCSGFFEFKSNPSLFVGKKVSRFKFCGSVISKYKTYKYKFYFKNKEHLSFYIHFGRQTLYSCGGCLYYKFVENIDCNNSSEESSEYSNSHSDSSDFYEYD